MHEFPIPTANSRATGIVAGPDGAMWFTERGVNKIAPDPDQRAAGRGRAIPASEIGLTAPPTLTGSVHPEWAGD